MDNTKSECSSEVPCRNETITRRKAIRGREQISHDALPRDVAYSYMPPACYAKGYHILPAYKKEFDFTEMRKLLFLEDPEKVNKWGTLKSRLPYPENRLVDLPGTSVLHLVVHGAISPMYPSFGIFHLLLGLIVPENWVTAEKLTKLNISVLYQTPTLEDRNPKRITNESYFYVITGLLLWIFQSFFSYFPFCLLDRDSHYKNYCLRSLTPESARSWRKSIAVPANEKFKNQTDKNDEIKNVVCGNKNCLFR